MTEDNVNVKMYAACLVDLLGQQEELSGWSLEDKQGTFRDLSKDDMLAPIKNTIGSVMRVKEYFLASITGFYSQSQTDASYKGIPEEMLRDYRQVKKFEFENQISIQQFSDTLVFYAPVSFPDLQHVSLLHFVAQIQACAIAMFQFWQEKKYFRGGITVDYGTYHDQCGFYGPVLAHAHYLEAKIAQYPRVVVSKRCFALMNAVINSEGNSTKKSYYETIRRVFIEDFTYQDDDGFVCVDYLGEHMPSYLSTIGETEQTAKVHQIFANACDREEEYREKEEASQSKEQKEENGKIHQRYKRMRKYIERRLHIWKLGDLVKGNWDKT